ncbi:MAG TPA: peptidase [Pilimelia sp.]|nr:peptidase [Pilimelia sp.]
MTSSAIRIRSVRRATLVGILAAALATGASGALPGAALAAPGDRAGSGVVFSAAQASPAAARAAGGRGFAQAVQQYWTPARMKSAVSADALVATRAKPTRTQAAAASTPDGPSGRVAPAAPAKPPRAAAGKNAAGAAAAGTTTAGRAATHGRQALANGSAADWPGNFWSAPATTTGKVFFTGANGGNYVCSGSTVNSEARNTVFTAGHCVSDGQGRWHHNWVFVPDYLNGWAPFGVWSAKALGTTSQWFYSGDFRHDIGAAVLHKNSSGQNLINIVGGQGIAWNQARGQYVYAFGYPQAAPFDGTRLKYCDGASFNDPWSGNANLGLYCNMTGGSSGGPWLAWFNGTWGYVNGVNSYKYGSLPQYIFSPYFGSTAGALYNAVRYYY